MALLVPVIACSTTPEEVAPTPNIDATVEARVEQEVASQPTTTAVRVVKEVVPTDTPAPSNTLFPTPATTPAPPQTESMALAYQCDKLTTGWEGRTMTNLNNLH